MTPESMIDELDRLQDDLALLIPALRRQMDALAEERGIHAATRITIVGHGDSFMAGLAAELAFEAISRLRFRVLHAQYFVDYASRWQSSECELVIGVSASGNTPSTVQAIRAAQARGAGTLAVTGSRESDAARAADWTLLVELLHKRPSPGIRTYQASLTALLIVAFSLSGSQELLAELTRVPALVGMTVRAARASCDAIAALIGDASSLTLAGTGPGYGLALYGAAKMSEALGLPATGQDLEEWWHVQRFQRPRNLPLIVIGIPGRSRQRALRLAHDARTLGRRVIVVAPERDAEWLAHADAAIPVVGEVSEDLSPLLYHIFAGTLAAALATKLGRNPFDTDAARATGDSR